MTENKPVAMTAGQLAKLYKVDKRTFLTWIERFAPLVGERVGNIYIPSQVQIIFNCLGEP